MFFGIDREKMLKILCHEKKNWWSIKKNFFTADGYVHKMFFLQYSVGNNVAVYIQKKLPII